MSNAVEVSGRRRRLAAVAVVAASLTLSGVGNAAEPVGPELTPKLRGLLVKEMAAIEAAMKETYGAIVRGEHTLVAERGKAIHRSFILEQSLTAEDRQNLKAAVPPDFLRMDQRFHQLSASLAEAGRQKDTGAQIRFFNRMTETCVACHSRYVTDRFPDLQEQPLPEWLVADSPRE